MKIYRICSAMLLTCCLMSVISGTYSSGNEGVLWENQQVYATNSSDTQLNYFSMKIDSQGYPRMCFAEKVTNSGPLKNTGYCLNYAYWNESGWQSFVMTFDKNYGQYCSLALDNNDYPHIVDYMTTAESSDLEYTWWNGTKWIFTTADAEGGNVGKYCSVAVDSKGYAHISYYNNADPYGLKYALIRGPHLPWDISTIQAGLYVGLGTSIALDSHDYPHISFYDVYHDNNSLRYASYNGVRWTIETVDSGQKVGEGSSLAIDTNDRPHISYHSAETNAVKYAYKPNDQWIIETVDTGDISPYTSLALDTSNAPHITYVDYGKGKTVKYAHKVGASWEIQDIATGSSSTIALSKDNTPHILYFHNGLYLATPLMQITNPSSNQILNQEESYNIQWNTFKTKEFNHNIGPYVKIELFDQAGHPVSVLTANTTNDGTYAWKISKDIKPGTYQLKVSDVSNDTRSAHITVVIQQQSFQGILIGILLIVAILVSLILLKTYLKKHKHLQMKTKKK